MYNKLSSLYEELIMLEGLAVSINKRILNAPKGILRIKEKRGKGEYYYKRKDSLDEREASENGRYMRQNEYELVRKLAQRDYDVEILKKVEKRQKAIKNFLEIYEKTDLGEHYENLNPYRKELIKPVVISDEEYVKRWLAVDYPKMGFEENAPEFYTEKGERVRSKSEKIIADKLNFLGIPYRYEYPLVLAGNITRRPDFMILKMPERKEVYLEHLGMLDKPEYIEDTVYKWNLYEKNGLYLGDTLFFTHETSKNPLNTRALDEWLRTQLV